MFRKLRKRVKDATETVKVEREMEQMIEDGFPVHTEDGRELYGKEAKEELARYIKKMGRR